MCVNALLVYVRLFANCVSFVLYLIILNCIELIHVEYVELCCAHVNLFITILDYVKVYSSAL